jgi:hypothetical protein
MEAVSSSETMITTYKTTLRHNPEDPTPHFHHCKNLKTQQFTYLHPTDTAGSSGTFSLIFSMELLFFPPAIQLLEYCHRVVYFMMLSQ